jgi:hypothetical protein
MFPLPPTNVKAIVAHYNLSTTKSPMSWQWALVSTKSMSANARKSLARVLKDRAWSSP